MIYFMTARDIGRVKIGYSRDPARRKAIIQTNCPARIEIEATVEGERDLETEFHRAFRVWRRHGEWFELCPVIEMAIRFLNSNDPIPDDVAAYLMVPA